MASCAELVWSAKQHCKTIWNQSKMCSVLGCYSNRAPRFRLPEDPDMRLEWVQFLATVNEQCFKESSWRDIAICCDHFERECFVNPSLSPPTLKPGAVPSLCLHSEESEPSDRENPEVMIKSTIEICWDVYVHLASGLTCMWNLPFVLTFTQGYVHDNRRWAHW